MSAPWSVIGLRVFLALSAATAIVAGSVAVSRYAAARPARITPDSVTTLQLPSTAIPAETGVFRTAPGVMATNPAAARRPAHPRTLATYRALRSYPGAPPRIPHGLTPEELQSESCGTCHERGGYSQRFGAYVPVTPHPEMVACLQCHVGDARLMAVPLPNTDPSARCSQCHAVGGAMGWTDSTLDWRPAAWPKLPPTTRGVNPTAIPHDLELRTNCLACHGAPSAVDAIRTPHPERANCRQCHLSGSPSAPVFTRRGSSGGAP